MTGKTPNPLRGLFVNPRPRSRGLTPPPESNAPSAPPTPTLTPRPNAQGATPKSAKREKRQPTGDHLIGYCRPPVKSRFPLGNPGGPGRKNGRRSQDSLLREELMRLETVRTGGRSKRVTRQKLINTLAVNTALKEAKFKDLMALVAEARRLFPEVAVDEKGTRNDEAAGQEAIRWLMSSLTLGGQNPGADPLADIATAANGLLGQGNNEGWDPAALDDDEEATDED